MSNKYRGEVEFKAGGETYVLAYGSNALCTLEEKLGQPVTQFGKFLAAGENLSMRTLRTLVWAGLQRHHKSLSEEAAGDVIDAVGFQQMTDLMVSALSEAFPPGEASPAAAVQ